MKGLYRAGAIVLALAAASLAALSVQAGRWWQVGADITIAPTSSTSCFGGECQRGGLAWVGGGSLWLRLGVATYAAGLIVAFFAVVTAAALAGRRQGRLPARGLIVSAVTAAVAGGLFVAKLPAVTGATAGRGIYFFAGGVACALAASTLTLLARPNTQGPASV